MKFLLTLTGTIAAIMTAVLFGACCWFVYQELTTPGAGPYGNAAWAAFGLCLLPLLLLILCAEALDDRPLEMNDDDA